MHMPNVLRCQHVLSQSGPDLNINPGAEVPEVHEMGANPGPAPTLHNP